MPFSSSVCLLMPHTSCKCHSGAAPGFPGRNHLPPIHGQRLSSGAAVRPAPCLSSYAVTCEVFTVSLRAVGSMKTVVHAQHVPGLRENLLDHAMNASDDESVRTGSVGRDLLREVCIKD